MSPGDFGYKDNIRDNLDFAPRTGFNWNVRGSNDLVIRGGTGLYFTILETQYNKSVLQNSLLNNAVFNNLPVRQDFLTNPTNGVTSYAQASTLNLVQTARIIADNYRNPYTWQSTIGFAKQLGSLTGLTVDLTHYNLYRDTLNSDPNLFYDPSTGYNKNAAVRPNAAYGQIFYWSPNGKGDYTALLSSLTRRASHNVQGGLTYTLVFSQHDENPITGASSVPAASNPFDYIGGEYATSAAFQRHTFRGWAVYDLPWDFSFGASYSLGSGNRYAATISATPYGQAGTQNRLNLGANGAPTNAITVPAGVLDRWEGPATIASGSVIPRNALDGTLFSRLDLRLTKVFKIYGSARATLFAELFNVFNHANYTGFNTVLSATAPATTALFGQPTAADVSRQGQLGFRVSF
jgi:hypothetical protein